MEVPQDTFALEPDEHPPVCQECGDPVPRHKRAHAKFCSDAHRFEWHRRHKDTEAQSDTEAIQLHFDKLAPLPLDHLPDDVAYEWQVERRFLEYSVTHNVKQNTYIHQLEALLRSGPEKLKDNAAYWAWVDQYEANQRAQAEDLMRSTWESNGDRRHGIRKAPGDKRVAIASNYEDPEDRLLDDRKDES